MTDFQRIVEFTPAFDKRSPEPGKNFGIGSVELRMVLKGPEGAVQFLLMTSWMLPHVEKELQERAIDRIHLGGSVKEEFGHLFRVLPADLGYHSPKPMWEGQTPIGSQEWNVDAMRRNTERMQSGNVAELEQMTEPTGKFTPCPYLDGKACYYDGSGLNAHRIWQVLLTDGSDGVWGELETYYADVFSGSAEQSA